MNVFSDYDYYYQQQLQLQQQQQQQLQMNNMDRIPYKLNEVLYPDHNKVLHSNEYSNAPYQVYNLDPNSQNNGFYLYKPIESVTEYITELEPNLNHEIETILKKNAEVWAAYESGRFDVSDNIENGIRKIVLKEKGTEGSESEFTIRKYRVTLTNRRRRHKKSDDHVLLVSFSNSSLNNTNNNNHNSSNRVTNQKLGTVTSNSIHKTPTPAIMVGNSAPDNDRLSIDYHNDMIDADAYLSGPGSDLINKIINGDDSFEFSDEDPHSIAAKLSYPESRQSQKLNKEGPTMSEQSESQESQQESQPDSFDDEYIDTYVAPQKASLGSAAEMAALSPAVSRRSDSRRTVEQYTPSSRYSQVSPRPSNIHVNETYGHSRLSQTSETTSYSQNTPVNVDYMAHTGTVNSSRLSGNTRPSKHIYQHVMHQHQTPQPTVRDTPVSLAAQSASISLRDIGPTTPSRLSTLNYTSEEVVKTPVTASSIRAGSRGSSTAAIPSHYEHNQDTQSIGPGSLAGGSLFGGFIPSNFETESQIQNDKSAFSEYTLSRNEAEQSVTNQILKDLMDMAEADRKSQNSLRPNSAQSLGRVSPTKSRIISRQSVNRVSPRQSTVQTVSPPPVELRLGSMYSRQSTNLNSTTPQLETATNTTTTNSRLTHTNNSRLSGMKNSPRQSSHISKTPTEIRMGSRQSVNGQLVSNQILQDLLDLADADARRSQTSIRIGSRQSGI